MRKTLIVVVSLMLAACGATQQKGLDQHVQASTPSDFSLAAAEQFAILTPSTTYAQEEDKQVLALTFEQMLRERAPSIRLKSLARTLSDINTADLAETYRKLLTGHQQSGLYDKQLLQKIAQATDSRYLIQLKLSEFQQGSDGRWSFLGIRILQTKFGRIRLFMQVWDAQTGAIAWEGMQEMSLAYDTAFESPVTFNQMVTEVSKQLLKQLP